MSITTKYKIKNTSTMINVDIATLFQPLLGGQPYPNKTGYVDQQGKDLNELFLPLTTGGSSLSYKTGYKTSNGNTKQDLADIFAGSDDKTITGSSNIYYSTNPGDLVAATAIPNGHTKYFGVCWGNNYFVSCGTGFVDVSDDGKTWTNVYTDNNEWDDVCYGLVNGQHVYVVVSSFNKILTLYPPSGSQGWTYLFNTTSFTKSNWFDVCCGIVNGSSRFVSASYDGSIIYSDDGINWTLYQIASTFFNCGLCWGNGLYVLFGDNNNPATVLYTSPDGITWTLGTYTSQLGLIASVCYTTISGSLFVAVGNNLVITSTDGITWNIDDNSPLGVWNSIAWGSNLLVGVGRSIVTSSIDADYWDTSNLPYGDQINNNTYNFKDVCYGLIDGTTPGFVLVVLN